MMLKNFYRWLLKENVTKFLEYSLTQRYSWTLASRVNWLNLCFSTYKMWSGNVFGPLWVLVWLPSKWDEYLIGITLVYLSTTAIQWLAGCSSWESGCIFNVDVSIDFLFLELVWHDIRESKLCPICASLTWLHLASLWFEKLTSHISNIHW